MLLAFIAMAWMRLVIALQAAGIAMADVTHPTLKVITASISTAWIFQQQAGMNVNYITV